jgi:mannosyl-3-phosphoglycerate phosphatase family protein
VIESHRQPVSSILVFCDLDDTLFAPHTFSVDASARRALDRLEREHLPLVFCSGRTRPELQLIQQELGICQPFICENGAAVFVPRGYFGCRVARAIDVAGYETVEFGKPYAEIVASLRRAADRLELNVVGFSDMSVEDVAFDCDVPLLQARLAKLREYSEPFRVVDAKPGAISRLFKALRAAGLDGSSRGRYHHVGALRRDIGGQFLLDLYRRAFGEVMTVAFGDHRSTVPLLRHADVPLVVRSGASDETTRLLADVPAARLTAADSVGAWAEAVLEIAGAAPRGVRSRWP